MRMKLPEILATLIPMLESMKKDKPEPEMKMDHMMDPEDKPSSSNSMKEDASELAKQKVIVMMLDGKEEDDMEEEC